MQMAAPRSSPRQRDIEPFAFDPLAFDRFLERAFDSFKPRFDLRFEALHALPESRPLFDGHATDLLFERGQRALTPRVSRAQLAELAQRAFRFVQRKGAGTTFEARDLRSSSMPATFNPCMNCE
jgi:hypothetical protein